ncbi:hypothetical protein COW95_01445 [Candidatus Peregrinibacteria bacterium CG22_combo_CG10-13_8_21_14_all_49_11]|nr:MAG: hypothetical protein COW95_01445 [Candidatus Peregrinibacteria bacterium CG22_combo_CG10-13_8_21_14_all_49_11]
MTITRGTCVCCSIISETSTRYARSVSSSTAKPCLPVGRSLHGNFRLHRANHSQISPAKRCILSSRFIKQNSTMPHFTLIQGSLRKDSRTALLIDATADILQKNNVETSVIDLRSIDMQFCDARKIEEYNSDIQKAYDILKQSDAYMFGMPVYCYSVSGPLKNFIDITSGAMSKKIAGILCNSGGVRSFLAAADLMKILSFESNVTTVQPIVHAYADDFQSGQIFNEDILKRIEKLALAMLHDL